MKSFLSLFILFGCTTSLTPGAEGIQVMKNDPSNSCTDLGPTFGHGGIEDRRTALKNHAFKKGANYVRLESVDEFGEGGTAFKCP